MPKRTNDFQTLVALINRCLGTTGKVQESALLPETVSGELREVDILISGEAQGYPFNIAIEVVGRKRKADTLWVEAMHGKHLLLPTNKLILVSENGFTKLALDKAKIWNIDAIIFEKALATDWDLVAQTTSSEIFTVTNLTYECLAIRDYGDGKRDFSPIGKTVTIALPNRETVTTAEDIAQLVLSKWGVKADLRERIDKTSQRTFVVNVTLVDGTFVHGTDGTKIPLLAFRLRVDVDQRDAPIKCRTGRYRESDVVMGSSSDPNVQLHYVLVRKEGNQVEGLLQDDLGLRKLTLD